MYMTEADICREYRQAKDKQAQIGILAELNLCGQAEIAAVLARGGEDVPTVETPPAQVHRGHRRKGSRSWDTVRARALYDEGRTDQEIAKAVGVAPSTVLAWRRDNGLPSKHRTAGAAEAGETPAPPSGGAPAPPKLPGPVELSMELNGCAFALRAPDMETAVWACACARQLLEELAAGRKEDR